MLLVVVNHKETDRKQGRQPAADDSHRKGKNGKCASNDKNQQK